MKKLYFACIALTMTWAAAPALAAPARIPGHTTSTIVPFTDASLMSASVSTPTTPSALRLSTLDIVGVGLSVEMFRQGKVWDEMQKQGMSSILPKELDRYPNSFSMRRLVSEKRAADVMEWTASSFVENWPIPSLSVWPKAHKPEVRKVSDPSKSNYDFLNDRIEDLCMPAGMHHHDIAKLGAFFRDEPEEVIERAFRFFELNPEVPALILYASDGDLMRTYTGDMSRKPFWEDGARQPGSMTETFVGLVLVRRDRIDALRAYLPKVSDVDKKSVFHVLRAKQAQAQAAATPAFQPTKFIPQPWTEKQFYQVDRLPTIAVLHRPVRVSYHKDEQAHSTSANAKPKGLMNEQQRQAAFKAGLDAALAQAGTKPARIFYDAGGPSNGGRIVPLSLAVHADLPDLDLFAANQGFDIYQRLGDTGATSPFVQWALAAFAGYHKQGPSLTVNLRQNEEATLTMITPANDSRQHPKGDPINFNLAPDDGSPAVPVKRK